MTAPASDLIQTQEDRRQRIFALHRQTLAAAFSPDGGWLRPQERDPGLRERLCHAAAFLQGDPGQRRLGNQIIRGAAARTCEFAPMTALQLLLRYPALLDSASFAFLREYAASQVDRFHDHIHSFWGMNWNQVCMGTFVLLAGGEYLRRPDLVEAGRDNLLQAREQLHTTGFSSEFLSPTYTPIAMGALQEIVHLVQDPQAVDLARQVLARLWLEVACFWHAPTWTLGGPMSRAYAPDSMGLPHHLHVLLYLAFGEEGALEDMAAFFHGSAEYARLVRFYDTEGASSFFQHGVVAQAIPHYEVPAAAADLLFGKTYPYSVTGTVELAEESVFALTRTPDNEVLRQRLSPQQWPCQRAVLRAYHTADYALGTSTGWWLDGGQTEQFLFVGRRRAPVRGWADRTTVFARYLLNDHAVGGGLAAADATAGTRDCKHTHAEGLAFTAQHRDLVLYACQPKRFVRQGIWRLRLAVVLPAPVSGLPDEVWYGDQPLREFAGEFTDQRPIYLRWGRAFLALRPLALADLGRPVAVRLGLENGFGVISLLNYEGPPRDFGEVEILEALNGFVARAGSETEGDFAAFRARALAGRVIDQYYLFVRRLRYLEPGLQLALEYSPNSLHYKQISINGRQELPHSLEATGLDRAAFPFLAEEVCVPNAEAADWCERIGRRRRDTYRFV